MEVDKKKYKYITNRLKNGKAAILQGGRRSGKTYCILQYIAIDIYSSEESKKVLIVTDTLTRARLSIFADALDIFSQFNERIKKRALPILSITDEMVEINFVHQETNFRGFPSNYDYIFFNEANTIPKNVYNSVLKCAGKNCKFFIDFNPYAYFWVNDIYKKEDIHKSTYKDNVFLNETVKNILSEQEERGKAANIGTMERYFSDVECLGEFGNLSGRCINLHSIIPETAYSSLNVEEYLGADWGGSKLGIDPDVIIGVKFSGNNIYIKEYHYGRTSLDVLFNNVKAISFTKQLFIYETATDGRFRCEQIYDKTRIPFRFIPAKKGAGSVEAGLLMLREFNINVTETSFNILNEIDKYVYVAKGDFVVPIDKYNHSIDALRYVVSTLRNSFDNLAKLNEIK